ncbi:response regulator transcription factor [Ahrensia sp. 13_GOM-1096m]|uniref:response regulator n=1 Tax=Ahrensia sp. 13_GOM-1096m TaxID=1380380 RepID=UPI000478C24D|nr:response regulator transcription factor [Ahrensia sp. 13_GOM-1096m]
MKILLVEDDPLIARDVKTGLENAGYLVVAESNGEEAWFLGDTEEFTAVILDLGLPVMDGLTVLRKWRENGRTHPVLVLTARGDWTEKVEGIDAGADDYLAKPFQMEELLARLRAIIRRTSGQASPIITVHSLRIDTRHKTVSLDGKNVALTPMEYRCLHYLALKNGDVVSQIELTEQLYTQDYDRESNSVEVLIGRLRKKLGSKTIATKRGFGYFLPIGQSA